MHIRMLCHMHTEYNIQRSLPRALNSIIFYRKAELLPMHKRLYKSSMHAQALVLGHVHCEVIEKIQLNRKMIRPNLNPRPLSQKLNFFLSENHICLVGSFFSFLLSSGQTLTAWILDPLQPAKKYPSLQNCPEIYQNMIGKEHFKRLLNHFQFIVNKSNKNRICYK